MSDDKYKLVCSNGLQDDRGELLAPYISPPAPDSAGTHPQRLTCKKTVDQYGAPTGNTAWTYQGNRVRKPASALMRPARVGPSCERPKCSQTYANLNESLSSSGFELDYTEAVFNSNRIPKHPKSKEIVYSYSLDTGTSVRERGILPADSITVKCKDRPGLQLRSSIDCRYMNPNLNYDQSIGELDSNMCRNPTGGGRPGGGRRSGGGSSVTVRQTECGAYYEFRV
jgi:hypothetical protein